MNNHIVTKVVLHKFNGFEEEVKTVEVDGKKFVADETDPSKPKLDDKQQPILFVEKKVEVPKIEDLSKAELAEIAKHNPALAKLLDDNKKRAETDAQAEKDRIAKEEKEAEEKGNWKTLAETRKSDLDKMTGERDQKEEQLGKYVKTTEAVLKGLLESIPKENISLIPADFSPRQKLEYIIANASRLGAKVNAIGGKIDKNETEPTGTDEDKMVTRIEELSKKATARTATNPELAELRQLGSKLTALRREKDATKK